MSQLGSSRRIFRSLEAKSLLSRYFLTKIADNLTVFCGSSFFLVLNTLIFLAWIIINLGWIPGVVPFDPFPYGLLTMIVSLEAIFLSIFVLISQNRSAQISTVREEVHLQVDLTAEKEITKILQVLAEMREKMGIKEEDVVLKRMLSAISESQIEQKIERELESANSSIFAELRKDFPLLLSGLSHSNGQSKPKA